MANRLQDSLSPYLRQHADNPVDWFEWGEVAFAEAARREVPVFLSVGYAACHWCHVMAHESFEDPATAETLNQHFVAIKVDREERPDVDAVYMQATQGLTGHGGWPMSVFLTPERLPFFAGTYFPPAARHGMPSFRQVLGAVSEAWTERRDEVHRSASTIVGELAKRQIGAVPGSDDRGRLRRRRGAAAGRVRRGGRRLRRRPEVSSVDGARGAAPRRRRGGDDDGRRRPRRRWPGAASTTSWPAGSRATASTPAGWCRTSRRCSTTTRCCWARTPTGGGGPQDPLAEQGGGRDRRLAAHRDAYARGRLRRQPGCRLAGRARSPA